MKEQSLPPKCVMNHAWLQHYFFNGKISPKNVKILKIEVILEVFFNHQKVREKK
jgi:hypothetical protein